MRSSIELPNTPKALNMTKGWERVFSSLSLCMVTLRCSGCFQLPCTHLNGVRSPKLHKTVLDLKLIFQRFQKISGKFEEGCLAASLQWLSGEQGSGISGMEGSGLDPYCHG